MVSAKSKEEHVVEGFTSGSNDYMVKPFGRYLHLQYIPG
jgi:DNA-binding response OmpR family regulator